MRATYPPYLTAHLEDHVTDVIADTTVRPIPAHMEDVGAEHGSVTTSGVLLDNDEAFVPGYLDSNAPGHAAVLAVGVAVLDALDQVRPVEPGNDGPLYVQVIQDEDGTVVVRVMDENTDGFSRSFPIILMERRVQLPAT